MAKLSERLRNLLPVLVITSGVLVLFYPTISNYLNERNNSRVVSSYDTTVQELEEEKRLRILQSAYDYNQNLLALNGYEPPRRDGEGNDLPVENYEDILNVNGDGVMGYITLPKLSETAAIYHGSSESVLQSGIGHLENTSLPVGGESTHAALSGHRGLPSKRLFTDLNQMAVGDIFYITVLGETLAYQVDQILTVLPHEMEALAIESGKDYVTLITCTPYGVNSHRLLVRGTRIPYEEAEEIQSESDSAAPVVTQTNKELYLAGLVLIVFFVVRFIFRLIFRKKRPD